VYRRSRRSGVADPRAARNEKSGYSGGSRREVIGIYHHIDIRKHGGIDRRTSGRIQSIEGVAELVVSHARHFWWKLGVVFDLLPIEGTRFEPLVMRLCQAAALPYVFIFADSYAASRARFYVAVFLALLDLGLLSVKAPLFEFKGHWIANTLIIVLAITSAVAGVFAVREEFQDRHFVEDDEGDE
jgi:hypothetical protein